MRKYNVGDKVTIKSKEWYDEKKDSDGIARKEKWSNSFTNGMNLECGKTHIIERIVSKREYRLKDVGYWWDVAFFEKPKKGDIPIGTRVVPHDKTVVSWPGLESSQVWKRAKEQGQPFLYVCSREAQYDTKGKKVYGLTNEVGEDTGDYFMEDDFTLYVEPKVEPTPIGKYADVMVDISSYPEGIRQEISEICQRVAIESGKARQNITSYNADVVKEANTYYYWGAKDKGLTYSINSGASQTHTYQLLTVTEWCRYFLSLKYL